MTDTHDRNDAIYAQRQAGATWVAIGHAFGLSRERVRQIVKTTRKRHQRRGLPLSIRAWNVLKNIGVLQPVDTFETITREVLIARIRTVDLETIGAAKNMGVRTLHEIAALVGCSDRFKQRGTGVVRIEAGRTDAQTSGRP